MTAIAEAGNGSLVDYIGFSDFADDLQADRLPASCALYCLVLDLHRLDDLFQTRRCASYRHLVTHRQRGLQLYYGYRYLREEVGDLPDFLFRLHHGLRHPISPIMLESGVSRHSSRSVPGISRGSRGSVSSSNSSPRSRRTSCGTSRHRCTRGRALALESPSPT